MSGGRFDYQNDNLCREMFNWRVTPVYGLGEKGEYTDSVKEARRVNPMQDKLLSELLYDVFCLIHSLDWAESGDTDEEVFRQDAQYFKRKWMRKTSSDLIKQQIETGVSELREELYNELYWGTEEQEVK